MCVPQGVAGGRTEGPAGLHQSITTQPPIPHPPSEIKVIGGPDELAEQILAPSRAQTHVCTSPPCRLELERGKSAPGVTNGIAVCLQALRQYDLVTKWHTIVLRAHRLHGFQLGELRECRSHWPTQLVRGLHGSVANFQAVSQQLCIDFHPFSDSYSPKFTGIILQMFKCFMNLGIQTIFKNMQTKKFILTFR